MSWFETIGVAIGLAMDAFAVSIAAGLSLGTITPRHVFRLAFHFGLFQFLMPILGWCAGSTLTRHVAAWDHWLAFGLLAAIGGKMLLDAFRRPDDAERADPTRGVMLVGLSVATSIDALAVGLSMAFMRSNVLVPCVIIGLVAASFSAVGMVLGRGVLSRWGRPAEVLGGCVLILIGVKILCEHLRGPA